MELVTLFGYSWIFLIFVTLHPILSIFMHSSHSSLLSFRHLERRFGCKWTLAFKTFQPNPIALSRSWPACPCISTNSRLLFALGSPSVYLQYVSSFSLSLLKEYSSTVRNTTRYCSLHFRDSTNIPERPVAARA
jgi:hypothetical protein